MARDRLSGLLAREIVQNVPALVLVLTRTGTILYINTLFEGLTGYSLVDVEGDDALTLLIPARAQCDTREVFIESLTSGGIDGITSPIVTRSGEERHIEWSVHVVDDEVGKPGEIIIFGKDVTSERAVSGIEDDDDDDDDAGTSADARYEGEELVQSLLDSFPGLASLYALDGRIVAINRSARKLSGRAVEDIQPPWARRIEETDPEALIPLFSAFKRIVAGGDREVFEVAVGGRILEAIVTPVRGAAGQVSHVAAFATDVTERSLAMQEVEQSEDRLRETQRLANFGSWELDLVTGVLDWSDEIYQLFDYERASFGASYEAFLARVHPDDREEVDDAYKRSLAGRTDYAITHRLLLPGGRVRYVSERGRTIYSVDGTPLRSVGTVQDISPHFEATAQMRRILDNMFAFVAIFDTHGRVLEINRAPLDLIGARREDIIGQPLWDTYWWSHSAELQARTRDTLARAARGEVLRDDHLVRSRGGTFITMDVMFGPLRGDDGEIEGVIASAVDISDRKAAESAAHQASEIIRALVNGAPVLLFAVENDGMVSLSEGQALASIGLAPGESVGGPALDLWPNAPCFVDALDRAKTGEEVRLSVTRGDLCFDLFLAPRRGPGGVIYGVVGVGVDVTRRQEQESRIAAQLAEKEVLLRELHHRVKNNLQVVSSLLHFQAKRARSPEGAAAFAEGRERIFAMILVHELLLRGPNLSRVDLGEYVRSLVAALVASQALHPRIVVEIDACEVFVPIQYALPSGMILAELLTNAFKYAFTDERGGRICVRVRCGEGRVSLVVEDDGVGVERPGELLDRGGFGLRLVRKLVLQLDGELVVESESGVRAQVSFDALTR